MRVKMIIGLLALGMVLLLAGCGDGSSSFAINGTVRDAGVPQAGATVTLLQVGGSTGPSQTTPASGAFSFPDVAPGTYILKVVNDGVTTYYGPFRASGQRIIVEAPTAQTLPNNLTVPSNGTATLIATAQTANGTAITSPLQIQADSFTNNTVTNPAVVTGVISSTYPVFITDTATGNLAIFPNITLAPNSVTVFRAIVTPSPSPVTLTGTVTNNGTPTAGLDVFISRSSSFPAAFSVTTSAGGAFTFTDITPGTYYLYVKSPVSEFYAIYGPINVTNTPPAPINFELNPDVEITIPLNPTTAVAVARAFEGGVEVTDPLSLTVGVLQASGPPPVVRYGIAPGSHDVIVRDTVTNKSVVFADVPFFSAGSIIFFHAVLE
ncbi:MAG: carboxypeptidase-like regulatory domain-containing protein [Armatimonadota bacterium]